LANGNEKENYKIAICYRLSVVILPQTLSIFFLVLTYQADYKKIFYNFRASKETINKSKVKVLQTFGNCLG